MQFGLRFKLARLSHFEKRLIASGLRITAECEKDRENFLFFSGGDV